MMCSLFDLAQPEDEIALFLRAALALQDILAIAPKPFFDLGGIGEPLRIGRRRQWLDTLADAGAPGLFRAVGVTAGTTDRLGVAR
jgi:hypothetical protein